MDRVGHCGSCLLEPRLSAVTVTSCANFVRALWCLPDSDARHPVRVDRIALLVKNSLCDVKAMGNRTWLPDPLTVRMSMSFIALLLGHPVKPE